MWVLLIDSADSVVTTLVGFRFLKVDDWIGCSPVTFCFLNGINMAGLIHHA